MGLALSGILGLAGCIRALVFAVPWAETLAITTSLLCIVFISILLGALLPLGMKRLHIDPAHSSTTIQVLMDILGVSITVGTEHTGGESPWNASCRRLTHPLPNCSCQRYGSGPALPQTEIIKKTQIPLQFKIFIL